MTGIENILTYATIIDNKQLLTLNYKQIISKFFYDNKVDDEQFLSDGTGAVR
jgi:hypothetical protein